MTKDSVKKEDEKEEEKPDMRSKYAMINIIKNKLRAAGQRDPMVMAVDACEENIDETIIRPDGTPTHTGRPKKDNAPKNTERTPAPNDDSFDIMRPGGKNSPYDKDGKPKKLIKKLRDGAKAAIGTPPMPPAKKYNPYGKGATANPSNMSGSTCP